jgi:putative ABC transport system permease protein
MFKNYFKTAFRNLARNKVYSFINIAGLSLGLACAMLIMLYVKDEVSFDRFHKNVQNIYRVVSTSPQGEKMGSTGALQGPRFTQHVAGIESFVRLSNGKQNIKTSNYVQTQDLMYADTNFFSVFSFPLLWGDAKTCLADPHSIVLSEDIAVRQFGTTDAVGKIVMLKQDSNFVPYKVTAISKRCPQNSSIQFEVLLPITISAADEQDDENWFGFSLNTFVVLNNNVKLQTVEKQMQRFYLADAKQAFNAIQKENGGNQNAAMSTYFLQPYVAMHLSTELPVNNNFMHLRKAALHLNNGLTNSSNPVYSYILSGIALFVLLIACINFVNLTIARSVKRAKEIGIRKVIGGNRKQLMFQFLGESFFLCSIAFVLAIALAQWVLPLFGHLSNKALSLSYLFDTKLVAAYIVLYIITGFLAGFYPALVLSGYHPVQTLYNRFQVAGKTYLQKGLVVLQFSLASFLIIATFSIYAQFNFLTKTNLGYDDSNLIITEVHDTKHADAAIFKNELMKNPNIAGVSAKNGGTWQAGIMLNDSGINAQYETVDENYLPLLKIPSVAGRNFSPSFPADSVQSVIINESFAKAANWKNPVGETVHLNWGNIETYRVIGVIKDYHFASLNDKIMPQLFGMKNDNLYGSYYIKIKPGSETASLQWIQKLFQQFYPTDPFSYVFQKDVNRKEYADLEKWKQVMLFGAVLTIFISCIGLFGLSVLSSEKRTKEIGIRKVLGASVSDIVTTLSKDFLLLVFTALIITIPFAWLATNNWLKQYPYRIALSMPLFAGAGLLVILIAMITISFQSIKTALANPIKSLRTD